MEVVEKVRKEKKEFDKLWKFVEKETGLPIVLEVHDRGMVYVDHESYGLGSQVLSMSKRLKSHSCLTQETTSPFQLHR